MALYPYRSQLVVDPDNPRNVVAGGSVSIYDSEDTSKTTLLALTDPNGVPIPNPFTSYANGLTPAFVTTSPEVLWVSGSYTDYFQSYKGMRDEAAAAREAAEAAAASAGAEAAAVADAAIGDATAEATAAKAAAETAASNAVASATAAANSASLVGAPADTAIAAVVNNSASATKAALNATYATTAALTPKLDKTGTKTDTSAGLFDWANNAASGYLFHLRSGANSTGAGAAIGIGTDQGSGNGVIISHKNTGIGILATGQPGSGRIAEFTSRGTNSGFWTNVQAGGGAFQVNARDGQAYADGASTSGSTTFTSATAAFVAGDVGKAITQLTSKGTTDPFGSIPGGTTIASVTNATTVELSQPATATGTAVLFNIAGRVPAASQALFRVMDTDLIAELVKFTRGGATFNTADAASTVLRVNAKTGQSADIIQAYDAAGTKVFSLGSNGGIVTGVLANFANGALPGAAALISTTFSSHAAIKGGRGGAGTGNNFEALGAGTTALSRFNKDGYFMTTKSAAPADADIGTGELALWVDTTAGAAKLMIKAKDSAGAVKTGSVTLA